MSEHAKPVPVTPVVVAEDDNQAIGVISHHEAVELLHLREFYQVGVHIDCIRPPPSPSRCYRRLMKAGVPLPTLSVCRLTRRAGAIMLSITACRST